MEVIHDGGGVSARTMRGPWLAWSPGEGIVLKRAGEQGHNHLFCGFAKALRQELPDKRSSEGA